MSLLDNIKKSNTVEGEVTVDGGVQEATPKKKSNSEYQKRQRELATKYGQQLKAYFGDNVPEELKEVVAFFAKEKKAMTGSTFGKPVFYKLFGDAPKKGDKVTALKIFEETGKGYAEMRSLMKKWTDKQGITVVYKEDDKSYEITSDNIPAYVNA